jgi:hypothetical protein
MSYKIGYFVWPEPQRAKRRVLVSAAAEAKLTDEQIEALFIRFFAGDWGECPKPSLCVNYAGNEGCGPRLGIAPQMETHGGFTYRTKVPSILRSKRSARSRSPLRERIVDVWTAVACGSIM